MPSKPITIALALTALLTACSPSNGREQPELTQGMQVGSGALTTPELVAVADLGPGDRLYQIPVGPETAVLVRVREDEAPLMFATSCGLLSSFDLPTGWEGRCLERIVDGQLQKGVFLYATVE